MPDSVGHRTDHVDPWNEGLSPRAAKGLGQFVVLGLGDLLPIAKRRQMMGLIEHHQVPGRRLNLGFPICPPRMAPLYTQRQRSARNPCSSQHRPASEAVSSARAAVRPLKSLRSGRSADTAPDVCPFGRQVAAPHGPRVSLPAPAAPKSAAACRRTAAWSDALLPAGASSTGHALRAGPRSSPAAAGDS